MKNKLKYLVMLIFAASLLFVTAHASTSDELANQYYLQMYGSQFPNFNSPYTIVEGEGVVSENTGALCTNVEDYRIEGKNDFDVSIVRSYNTLTTEGDIIEDEYNNKKDTAEYFYNYYICSADNSTVTVRFNNEAELAEADPSFEGRMYYSTSSSNWYHRLKSEGTGIYYTLSDPAADPSIAIDDSYYIVQPAAINTDDAFINMTNGTRISKPALIEYDGWADDEDDYSYVMFQDLQGRTHAMEIHVDKESDPDEFKSCSVADGVTYSEYDAYMINNKDMDEMAVHPLGFEYNMTLKSDDGFTYYVNRKSTITYKILYAEDCYGNGYKIDSLTNGYSITTDDGVIYTVTSSGVTKTYNDEVTELVSYTHEKVLGQKDTYNKYDIDDEYVLTVKKNSGTTPQIAEDEQNVIKYYMKRGIKYEYILHRGKLSAYVLPYKIEMPTGLTKNIEYTSIPWTVSHYCSTSVFDGFCYPVSRYYETDKEGNVQNESTYTYTTAKNKNTGYLYMSNTTRKDLSNGATNKTITTVLDKYGRITSQTAKKDASNYDEYTYNYVNSNTDSKLSSLTEKNVVNGVSATQYRSYSYLNSYYPTRETHGIYEVNYTYHTDGNYIPSMVTYKQDADTTIKTENILTEDKKSIATTNVYENDVLIKSTSYTYDSYGNIASETLSMDGTSSIVTTYAYDYGLDGSYTLTTTVSNLTDADGNAINDIVTVHSYDADHNLIAQIDANGNPTVMTYDHMGRLLGTQYADGTSDSYSYDISEGITTYTAPNGTVYKAYFDAWGNIIKTTAIVDGTETQFDSYEYDDRGNVTSYIRYIDGDSYVDARYTYDYLNRPLTEKVYENGSTLLKTTTYAYSMAKDASNRPLNTVTVSVTGDGGDYASYSETTNYRGYLTESKSFTEDEQRVNYYTHDYIGNVITATDAAGNVTTVEYDGLNNPIRTTYADGSATTAEYNLAGLVSSETDALGNSTNYIYDNAGRLIKLDTPFDDYNRGLTKTYYDPNGNVISTRVLASREDDAEKYTVSDYIYNSMNRVSDAATYPTDDTEIHTRYEYDSMGNPIKVVSGLSSENAPESEGQAVTYEYDELGRMTKTTTPDGKSQSAEYDLQGRVTGTTDKANRNTLYTYDAFDNVLSKVCGDESVVYTYNLLGLRTSMTDSSGLSTYTYNPYGELTTETKGDTIKSYTYDLVGNPVVADIKGFRHEYTYDKLGRLLSMSVAGGFVEYTYDANSNLLSSAMDGDVYSETEYNAANLPVVTKFTSGGGVEDLTRYTYNPDGNLAMSMGTDTSSMYYYDGANRLVYENTWGDSIGYDDKFTYDSFGNRINREHRDYFNNTSENTAYTYNSINQLVSKSDGSDTVTFAYDTVGNMTAATKNGNVVKQYTYDPFNRLKTANVNGNSASYIYNGDNLRQSKTANGETTTHVYNGSDIVVDWGNGSNIRAFYARGNGLAFIKCEDGMEAYGTTPRGDVVKLFDGAGTKGDYTYSAYGEVTGGTPFKLNAFGYTGEYTDIETGLIYLRNRYYDPELGIFLTEDPAQDGFNWYAYCGGNPVMFLDPWGLFSENDILVVGGDNDYNDVRVLQNALSSLGYYNGQINGSYNEATKNAVINYQKNTGLLVDGKTGIQTWKSLGLIYLTNQDEDAGVSIVTLGLKQYFDITKPITKAVSNAVNEFSKNGKDVRWFIRTVKNTGKWNVKRNSSVWSKTLGISENTYDKPLYFYGRTVVIDDIGNITYGYLGAASGYSKEVLCTGSFGYHVINHLWYDIDNEMADERFIKLGVDWYNGKNIQVRFGQ